MTNHTMLGNWMNQVKTYSHKIFIVLFVLMALMELGRVNIFSLKTDGVEIEECKRTVSSLSNATLEDFYINSVD